MENGSGYTVAAAKLVHLLWRLVCQKHCVPANQVIHVIINIIKNILNSYAVSSVFRCAFCQVYPHFCCQNYAPRNGQRAWIVSLNTDGHNSNFHRFDI